MSPTSSAQARQASSPSSADSIHESGSFAAHLKTIEKKIPLRSRYENFIGGKWVAPAKGGYFDNISPTTGQVICRIARSQAEDVELAIDAAHAVADRWGRTAVGGEGAHPQSSGRPDGGVSAVSGRRGNL